MKTPILNTVGIAVSAGLLAGCSRTPPCERDVEAYVMAQEFVKRELRAPATAEFPIINMRENTSIPTKTLDGKCAFRVTMNVDAENGFGAKIRQRFFVTLAPDPAVSGQWNLVSISSQ